MLALAADGADARHVPAVPELFTAELKVTQGCEGPGDPAAIKDPSTLRLRLSGRFAQAGYRRGRAGQTDAKTAWHPCGPDSIDIDDVEVRR